MKLSLTFKLTIHFFVTLLLSHCIVCAAKPILPSTLKQRVIKMETVHELSIAQEVLVPHAGPRLYSGALFGRELEGREGEVSAAVELIKTAAAGFTEQERNFSVAWYKFTPFFSHKKGVSWTYHQTICTRLLLRENCETDLTQVFVRHCKAEWRRFFFSLSSPLQTFLFSFEMCFLSDRQRRFLQSLLCSAAAGIVNNSRANMADIAHCLHS